MQLICFSFFLSGFAALIYEILWVRLLTLFCGNTTLATSAVLAAYMAGLALGSFIGGRAADRRDARKLLLFYACLEAGIALSGWLSGPAIRFLGSALLEKGLLNAPEGVQSVVYFMTSLLVLIAPTSLMGATLPVLTSWASRSQEQAERPLSLLYGLNTLGAVMGAATAGFVFISALGIRKTMLLAAASNTACALIAFSLWRASRSDDAGLNSSSVSPRIQLAWLPATGLFLSGAAAMICEVAWTRAFAQVIGSSTYAFTIMLATILAGLSAGSLLFRAFRRNIKASILGWGILFALIGLSVLMALPLFNLCPYAVARLFSTMGRGPLYLHGIQLLLCGAVMAVPTVLMGAALPWAVAAFRPEKDKIGEATGACYAANTLGAIAGSVLAGLVLVPMLGAERTLVSASWLYIFAALAAVLLSPETALLRAGCAAGAAALMIEAAVLCPSWDPRILSSGMFLYGRLYAGAADYRGFLKDMSRDKVVFYRDGRIATVAVMESPSEERYLRINGKTDASQGKDMATQLLLGALPWMMHPG
ncbi:MAG: fused MFS/spermidine synthase, partial [candidate division NC10 bacterium]